MNLQKNSTVDGDSLANGAGPARPEDGGVTLPVVAMAALVAHLDRYSAPGPDALVFPNSRGTYLNRVNFNRLVWRPAADRLGLDGFRFHDYADLRVMPTSAGETGAGRVVTAFRSA